MRLNFPVEVTLRFLLVGHNNKELNFLCSWQVTKLWRKKIMIGLIRMLSTTIAWLFNYALLAGHDREDITFSMICQNSPFLKLIYCKSERNIVYIKSLGL